MWLREDGKRREENKWQRALATRQVHVALIEPNSTRALVCCAAGSQEQFQ